MAKIHYSYVDRTEEEDSSKRVSKMAIQLKNSNSVTSYFLHLNLNLNFNLNYSRQSIPTETSVTHIFCREDNEDISVLDGRKTTLGKTYAISESCIID